VAQKRVSMRKIREALRQRHELGRSHREIATSLSVAHSTVREYLRRAAEAGVSWPVPADWDDERLETALFPRPRPSTVPRPEPDWSWVHRELARHKGVTLQLLWLEYKQTHPDGYQYSRFCERYGAWRGRLDVTIRQPYRGGEKAFIDYAGPTVPIVDRHTGEIREAQVFVAALGASSYTFVDLTRTRSLPDWISSHMRMFEFWGGVVELLIPDNEKAGVKEACYYEPDLNRTYHDLATHYGTTVLPARPRAPRDKAKAEAAVQNVERRVLAPLRDQTFFSLTEARRAIAPLLEALNARPFAKLEGSRSSLFEELDRPALRPLPATRFEYSEWSRARVNIDYHIQVKHHFYSVPHELRRQQVEVRLTASTVEVLARGRRVAAHVRSARKGGYTTDPAHMPAAHRAHLEWSPSRLVRWAATVGPETARFVEQLLESRPHPEQGYRSCLGLMRLARSHPAERMEAACHRALTYGTLSYRSIQSILSTGLDQLPLELEPQPIRLPTEHVHLRGADYYRTRASLELDSLTPGD
jgi:transposase